MLVYSLIWSLQLDLTNSPQFVLTNNGTHHFWLQLMSFEMVLFRFLPGRSDISTTLFSGMINISIVAEYLLHFSSFKINFCNIEYALICAVNLLKCYLKCHACKKCFLSIYVINGNFAVCVLIWSIEKGNEKNKKKSTSPPHLWVWTT